MKVSKSEAHYRNGNPDKRCSLCTMFKPPDGCTKVIGAISPRGLCDYFNRKTRTIAGGK